MLATTAQIVICTLPKFVEETEGQGKEGSQLQWFKSLALNDRTNFQHSTLLLFIKT